MMVSRSSVFLSSFLLLSLIFTSSVDGSKLGIAYDQKGGIAQLATGKASWYYTWSVNKATNANASVEFIPMLWGKAQTTDFQNALSANKFAGSSAILGFNEPDNSGQSNLDANTAASLWKTYLQPQGTKFRLGAPAVTSAPSGKTWMTNFVAACTGCKIDFIPIHWYGSDPNLFASYVQDFYNTFKKPIWVTEWACVYYNTGPTCTQNDIYSFMGQTTAFLDSQSYVERFSWFGMRTSGIPAEDALLSTDYTTRTGLGNQYVVVGGHT